MCGIVGFINVNSNSNGSMATIVSHMSDRLKHRGPDDSGIWLDQNEGIALGHRRLSIIDVSFDGHQPMLSRSGRYVLVFNGEVYNFKPIKECLEERGYIFRGHSDTETILNAIEEWGIEKAIKQFIGMFSFALWDRKDSALYLARDRIGIKPLYYGWMGNTFLFGSELKALRAHPDFKTEIDLNALALYFRFNNIPAPYSIYRDIYKLNAGTLLVLDTKSGNKQIKEIQYWSAKETIENGKANRFKGDENEAELRLTDLLRDAVGLRMISDVPLGAFLSGGIDSTSVVALMQSQSEKPVKTFTIGFGKKMFNEAVYAKKVAEYLGTAHTELYIEPEQALSVIPELPFIYDEPFADSSQIPTYLLSKLTREHVTVSLSGDGGDELFGGYNRYLWTQKIWSRIEILPLKTRIALSNLISSVSTYRNEKFLNAICHILPVSRRCSEPAYKLQKLADILRAGSAQDIYAWLVSHWKSPTELVKGSVEPLIAATDNSKMPRGLNLTENMAFLDLISYLPDDILVKVDRASMRVGLEARVPLLDHRVVEFASSLPLSMKIRNKQGKWILRQILYKYIPPKLVARPKMGFAVPIDSWLKNELRDWADQLLDYKKIRSEGFLNAELVHDKWKRHLNGSENCKDYLWPVLMFQLWKENYK